MFVLSLLSLPSSLIKTSILIYIYMRILSLIMIVAVCSADANLINQEGEYIWEPHLLDGAHALCFEDAVQAMCAGRSLVIDNTNTNPQHCVMYIEAAILYSYNVVVMEPSTPWCLDPESLAEKNSHGVPLEQFSRIIQQLRSPVNMAVLTKRR